MALVLPAQTVEYIKNTVTTSEDLTMQDVEVAIMSTGFAPDVGDWLPAEWDNDGNIRYLYDGTATAGLYDYWVRILGATEMPARNTGIIDFQGELA